MTKIVYGNYDDRFYFEASGHAVSNEVLNGCGCDETDISRGEEKGMFLYGGSTVILLIEKGRANIDSRFFEATERGEETDVMLGERIGGA